MKTWIGRSIIGIGILHTAVGLLFLQSAALAIISDGIWNSVSGQIEREALFWFTFTGILLMILGGLAHAMEKRQAYIPPFLGWSLLLLSTAGVIIMPVSGIWLMFPPAIGLTRRRRTLSEAKE